MSTYAAKKLIVCCDGTWKNSTSGWITGAWSLTRRKDLHVQLPTNITRIAQATKPVDERPGDSYGMQQVVFYQSGVGSVGNVFDRVLGGALGKGLSENIKDAYYFIAMNYMPGDEIYLIGFSRGAYTARCIGGLIADLGLLTKDGLAHFHDVFADWKSAGCKNYKPQLSSMVPAFNIEADAADPQAYLTAYRNELERLSLAADAHIEAIGVFDTVGALGVPLSPLLQRLGLPTALRPYRFYDTSLSHSNRIRSAFQILALDERRGPFMPTLFARPDGVQTHLEQVWTVGCHSDVGGGYRDSGLSLISLCWLMSRLSRTRVGKDGGRTGGIDFSSGFVKGLWEANRAYLEESKAPQAGRKWAASLLTDSASKLEWLKWWMTVRTPGRYHHVDRATAKTVMSRPLVGTNEKVHFAVRERERVGGLLSMTRMDRYEPKAMEGWEKVVMSDEPGMAKWVYKGRDEQFEGRVMEEAELGVFEKELLEAYEKVGS